jgi:hypothetical protein
MEKRSACLKTFQLILILLASLVISCFNVVSENQEFYTGTIGTLTHTLIASVPSQARG